MDAFGSGSEDAGGGEYEEVLDVGGNEEDAYVKGGRVEKGRGRKEKLEIVVLLSDGKGV